MFIPLLISMALAEDKPLNLKPKPYDINHQVDLDVSTKETVLQYNGQTYRKIEYEGKTIFVKLQAAESTIADEEALCQPPFHGVDQPKLVEMGVKTSTRTRVYLSAFEKRCLDDKRAKRVGVDSNPEVGIGIKNKSGTKETKIFVNPKGAGVKTDF